MRCPECNTVLAFPAEERPGSADGITEGDTIIRKSMIVLKEDGTVEVKCPGCKALVPLQRKVVFKRKAEKG